jgi:plastocyanin
MRRFAHRFLLLATLALPALACGDSNDATEVSVKDDVFDPASRTVSVGATVSWQWSGTHQHNVTWVVASTNSATQTTGTFMRTFATAGSYVYYCTIHGTPTTGMQGTIVVQ